MKETKGERETEREGQGKGKTEPLFGCPTYSSPFCCPIVFSFALRVYLDLVHPWCFLCFVFLSLPFLAISVSISVFLFFLIFVDMQLRSSNSSLSSSTSFPPPPLPRPHPPLRCQPQVCLLLHTCSASFSCFPRCSIRFSSSFLTFLILELLVVAFWDSIKKEVHPCPPFGFPPAPFASFLASCQSEFRDFALELGLDASSAKLCYRWVNTLRRLKSDADLKQYCKIAPLFRPQLWLYCKQPVSSASAVVASSSSSVSSSSFPSPPDSPASMDQPHPSPPRSSTSSRSSDTQIRFSSCSVEA